MPDQVYDIPQSYQAVPGKKKGSALWIIIIVAILFILMCCCVVVIAITAGVISFGMLDQPDYFYFLPSLVSLA